MMEDFDYEDYGGSYDDCQFDYDEMECDTFYALTDGMYGDYEDFKRKGYDIDDLYDMLGL